jgi:hypothetical protein
MEKKRSEQTTVVKLNDEQRKQIQQEIGFVEGLSGLDKRCETTKLVIHVKRVDDRVSVITSIIND